MIEKTNVFIIREIIGIERNIDNLNGIKSFINIYLKLNILSKISSNGLKKNSIILI